MVSWASAPMNLRPSPRPLGAHLRPWGPHRSIRLLYPMKQFYQKNPRKVPRKENLGWERPEKGLRKEPGPRKVRERSSERVHGHVDMWTCPHVDMWTCEHVDISRCPWIHSNNLSRTFLGPESFLKPFSHLSHPQFSFLGTFLGFFWMDFFWWIFFHEILYLFSDVFGWHLLGDLFCKIM